MTVAFPKDERDNSSGEYKMGVNETCRGNYLKENNKFPFFSKLLLEVTREEERSGK